jgi:hypothetical protein
VRHGLEHVINGQRGDTGARQRFHFHPGLMMHLAFAVDDDVSVLQFNGDLAIIETKRMTEWNQFVGLLGSAGRRTRARA